MESPGPQWAASDPHPSPRRRAAPAAARGAEAGALPFAAGGRVLSAVLAGAGSSCPSGAPPPPPPVREKAVLAGAHRLGRAGFPSAWCWPLSPQLAAFPPHAQSCAGRRHRDTRAPCFRKQSHCWLPDLPVTARRLTNPLNTRRGLPHGPSVGCALGVLGWPRVPWRERVLPHVHMERTRDLVPTAFWVGEFLVA